MHTVIEQKPKINHLLLPTIIIDLGLKQGDNLSPIEFNLFFDDVDQIFDETCDPLPIDSERKISHLSFANLPICFRYQRQDYKNALIIC